MVELVKPIAPGGPASTANAGPRVRAELAALLQANRTPSVVTMGTFDGVHRGHRALVAATRRLAQARNLSPVAITFSPRPDSLWSPDALPDICSLDERVRRLRRAGADRVVVIPFSRELASMGYEEFTSLVRTHLDMRALYVGEDFALGRGRQGTPARLRELGLDVYEHPLVLDPTGTEKTSSSSIRRAIASGLALTEALAAA